jgi:para-nitrobenzyl esterase
MTTDYGLTRRTVLATATVAATLAVTSRPAMAGSEDSLAHVTQGKLRGYRDGNIHIFKGIPYGRPTSGRAASSGLSLRPAGQACATRLPLAR